MKYNITIKYPGSSNRSFIFDSPLDEESVLEKIFAWFNHGSGQECSAFLNGKMRSLSVNDFVCVNGQWYQCKSVGWEKVTQNYVNKIENAVIDHPLFAMYGSFYCLDEIMFRAKHHKPATAI